MPSEVHQNNLTVLVWSPEGAVLGSPAPSGRSFAVVVDAAAIAAVSASVTALICCCTGSVWESVDLEAWCVFEGRFSE
jgi:hypothetical protein